MEKSFVNQKTLESFVTQLIGILEDVQAKKSSVERWKQAWKNMGSSFVNPTTGTHYNGVNVFSCFVSLWLLKTDEKRFLTFNKAVELARKWGLNPNKDNPIIASNDLAQNGTPIMYWGTGSKKIVDPITNVEEERTFRFVTGFRLHNLSLFNADFQAKFNEVYGAPAEIDRTIPTEILDFTNLVNANIGAEIRFTNEVSGPCYYPHSHKIAMPLPTQYEGRLETLKHDFLHESAHATKNVCGRDLKDYAREEIVAETAASFACLEMGVELPENYLSYILGWLKGNPAKTVMSLFGHIETAVAIMGGRYTPKATKEKDGEEVPQLETV